MSALLRSACEDFGPLVSIELAAEFPGSTAISDRFDQWTLLFEGGAVCVTVDPDWDTVRIGETSIPYTHVVRLTDISPWNRLIGCKMQWAWTLTNQREFTDGVQFEFAGPTRSWAIQLIAEASMLTSYSLEPLDRELPVDD